MDSRVEIEQPLPVEILADETGKGWDDTSKLTERLASFSVLKQKTIEFAHWIAESGLLTSEKDRNIIRKLYQCGDYLIFRNYLLSKRSRMIGACSCRKHLLCNFCAARRGIKHSIAYKERVNILKEQNPDSELFLITFTIKNRADLSDAFSHLRGAMQSLLKRRNREIRNLENPDSTRNIGCSEMSRLTGGVLGYEIKRSSGEGKLWHPHIHMLALAPRGTFLAHQALKDEWLELTGDSTNINIKIADDGDFLEVFAYALKFGDMSHDDRWHAYSTLVGDRLISSFGNFRNVELPLDENDDLLDSDETFVDSLYRWIHERGSYAVEIHLNSSTAKFVRLK